MSSILVSDNDSNIDFIPLNLPTLANLSSIVTVPSSWLIAEWSFSAKLPHMQQGSWESL